MTDRSSKSAAKSASEAEGRVPYDADTPLEEREGATSAMLKEELRDRHAEGGRDFSTPGAAPLGTGAEAAGQPSTAEQMETARRQEARHPDDE